MFSRPEISLNGEWEYVFGSPEIQPERTAAWQAVMVPSLQEWHEKGPHCLWFRRNFQVSDEWMGKQIVLCLDGVQYARQVWVNGNNAGQYVGGYERTEHDITALVKIGEENELLVGAQDWTATVDPAAKARPYREGDWFGQWIEQGILYPIGGTYEWVGIRDNVTLEARPAVWVEDVYVQTSTRESSLRVVVTVQNNGVTRSPTLVKASVVSGGPAPVLETQHIQLEAGEKRQLIFEVGWRKPHLWSPEDPHLYSLSVAVDSNHVKDFKSVRFGFREVWVEGSRFFLNGKGINLLAASIHAHMRHVEDPQNAYLWRKTAGCNSVRLHTEPWPTGWYDAADEQGILLISEGGLYSRTNLYGADQRRDDFWEHAFTHTTAMIKNQRNHPSIILWSAENEQLLCEYKEIIPIAEKRLGEMADLIHSLDPTRPVMFEGDDDPTGKADVINLHYPHEVPQWCQWPKTAFWFDDPIVTDMYPNRNWYWDRKKPLYLGEFGLQRPDQAHTGSVFYGDEAYPEVDRYRLMTKYRVWEIQILAARASGVLGTNPWVLYDSGEKNDPGAAAHRRGYQPILAVIHEWGTRFTAGTTIKRTISIINDSFQDQLLEFRWQMAGCSGLWEVKGSQRFMLASGDKVTQSIPIEIPEIQNNKERAHFSVEVIAGHALAFYSVLECQIYSAQPLQPTISTPPPVVTLFDPRGETGRRLNALGVVTYPIEPEKGLPELPPNSVIMVGKGAFETTPNKTLLEKLRNFVEQGGTLLVFEQESYPEGLIPITLSDHAATIAFPRRATHPLVMGLETDDLSHWDGDGLVSRNEMIKPAVLGFIPLVDSGGPDGLVTASLAEIRLGCGRMFLCQMDVTAKLEFHPIATLIFHRLIEQALQPVIPPAKLGIRLSGGAPAILEKVRALGACLEKPLGETNLTQYGLVALDPSSLSEEEAERLRQYVRSGGTVYLHALTPSDLQAACTLTGHTINLTPNHEGKFHLVERGGLAAGLSNFDFIWFGLRPYGDAPALPILPDIADFQLGLTPGWVAYTSPCLLATFKDGEGLWVIDQVRWDDADRRQQAVAEQFNAVGETPVNNPIGKKYTGAGLNQGKGERYIALLLSNLLEKTSLKGLIQ